MMISIASLLAGVGYVIGAQVSVDSPLLGSIIILTCTAVAANGCYQEQKLRGNQK